MKIELEDKDVERIADAVAARLKGTATTTAAPATTTKPKTEAASPPAPPPPPPPPAAPPGPTIEDVRTELNNYAAIESRTAAVELMKKVTGIAVLNDVPEDQYAKLIEALKGTK